MFTGIIAHIARVVALTAAEGGARLIIRPESTPGAALGNPLDGLHIGESIAVSGVCLTLESGYALGNLQFFLSDETLRRTTLALALPGSLLNLERALTLKDRLGGHMVMGHVDGVGTIERRDATGEGSLLEIRHPHDLAPFFAPKGSVAVDGISLTLVDSASDRFTVAVIPHTIAATALSEARTGQKVNLEADVLARYAVRGAEAFGRHGIAPQEPEKKKSLSLQKLIDSGFVEAEESRK